MAEIAYRNSPEAIDISLKPLIRRDQLIAVRQSVSSSIPVGIALAGAIALVAIHYGPGEAGLIWFFFATIVNIFRIFLCRMGLPEASRTNSSVDQSLFEQRTVEQHLRLFWITALVSGFVWSVVPVLCKGYTSPQTLFYLMLVTGTTAGVVTHGTAYARIPTCFITPSLVSIIGCLLYAGGFDRNCLAATVFLYLLGLIRIAYQGEAAFRESSRLKNEATTLAQSLKEAHARSTAVAEQMSYLATHDELTGLLNRTGFMQEVGRRAAVAGATLCIMLLDLNGFKSVNDVFGHMAGDRVLVEVARRLRASLTDEFTIARFGGDEFAVFYHLHPLHTAPQALATHLITAIEIPFASFDPGRIGISIGVHVSNDFNIAEMLTCADEALYVAKDNGRNRAHFFDDTLRKRLDMRRDVERDLSQALRVKALEVWYQPIVSDDCQTLINLEALLRWNHPKHGWIPPEELVSIAATTGLSQPLMGFIFEQVCSMIQTLCMLNLENVWVAMNVSPREISRVAVAELFLPKLREMNLSPTMLEIEITEETAMDIRSVQDQLNSLSRSGVRIAIDDFGVGYSSLASLRHLRVNRIKIDRCFVTGIANSYGDQILVQTILKLGHSLGIEVVAEGVETPDDLKLLRAFGCKLMQGYHLGRPAPQYEVTGWLKQRKALQSPGKLVKPT
jgi:diguanylate cyclase (GGDEF)-like protein